MNVFADPTTESGHMVYNVSVIFTRHDEIGQCNSIELLGIIEWLAPDVIFEELPYSVFDDIYTYESRRTLESDSIRMYLQKNNIDHIPVDTFDLPNSYHREVNYMLDRVVNKVPESNKLKVVTNKLMSLTSHGGFMFLNSDENDLLLEKIAEQEEYILSVIADPKLNQIAELRREVESKREDEIIDNIYKYSAQNVYKKAILFIGSGHRKSIIKKIRNRSRDEVTEIHWMFITK